MRANKTGWWHILPAGLVSTVRIDSSCALLPGQVTRIPDTFYIGIDVYLDGQVTEQCLFFRVSF